MSGIHADTVPPFMALTKWNRYRSHISILVNFHLRKREKPRNKYCLILFLIRVNPLNRIGSLRT